MMKCIVGKNTTTISATGVFTQPLPEADPSYFDSEGQQRSE
jgi:hypothetical protein